MSPSAVNLSQWFPTTTGLCWTLESVIHHSQHSLSDYFCNITLADHFGRTKTHCGRTETHCGRTKTQYGRTKIHFLLHYTGHANSIFLNAANS
ncbi:hypothetical protein NPIL_619231 [Nephila pilipes]|uniref:Uncharacterized protein n=1 Tax=Nephila pilipes TaxID=299642 RepID=A0A8X6KNT3_NEPPI|nr:hypothetical protein NPIL_619231 [Nephila pilipes]